MKPIRLVHISDDGAVTRNPSREIIITIVERVLNGELTLVDFKDEDENKLILARAGGDGFALGLEMQRTQYSFTTLPTSPDPDVEQRMYTTAGFPFPVHPQHLVDAATIRRAVAFFLDHRDCDPGLHWYVD